MSSVYFKSILFLSSIAVPMWFGDLGKTVAEIRQSPLATLTRQDAPITVTPLQWSLDLSDVQSQRIAAELGRNKERLKELTAELESARCAAACVDENHISAPRRLRELAAAEVQLRQEQRLQERRLRSHLNEAQLATLERYEEQARALPTSWPAALAFVSGSGR